MRVALIHYWLLGSRGGEKVLEAICRVFPDADIFTLFYDPAAVSPTIRSMNVHTSYLNPGRKIYRALLPLMPMALEDFDLRPYDLVISSESGPAKGVLTSANTAHFCYCHSPMRYLWELYPAYRHDFARSGLSKAMLSLFASYLRTWDYASAARVDAFMANSRNTKRRIWKTYRRRSRVVYPPVAVETFECGSPNGYFLMVGEMVAYKQLDYAVRAFSRNGRKLKIAGAGPEYASLKRRSRPNIEFCGRVSDNELRDLFSHADALIVPGEEDFGITMVEAFASGKPVIALARGGALEIAGNGGGILYEEANEAGLEAALQLFDHTRSSIDPKQLAARAAAFSESAFQER
ncbi:MAG TPA: glycosyltransferase, partial [Bryobacteraceae bacterium]|nr:glycosyltransferase [Bryobacteraceae bacterium]